MLNKYVDSPMSMSIPRRPNLWDTPSEPTFAFIHQCISQCDSNHECKESQFDNITRRAPRRLIRIDNQQNGLRINLVETSSLSEFPQYCTSSYCWGDPAQHRQTKTLKMNIDQHKTSIDVSHLPKTILDALVWCRELKLLYLWVDALCIIQDDDVDKLSEIAAMGDIYANAYLTIAASTAAGSSDGFLEPRENPFFSAPIPTSNGSMGEVKWAIRGNGLLNSSNMVTLNNAKVKMAKDFEPLHSRGWTFQEAMLSKRILFYSFFQPYWICQGMACSGGEPSPEEYFTAIELREMFESLSRTSKDQIAGQEADGDMGYQWPWVAEQYSSRILSMLGDKILAIHSIKDKYKYGDSAYASGVWLETLKVDLLWSTTRRHLRSDEEARTFASNYQRGRITDIPSWSWLSFDGSIRFDLVWHAFHLGKIRHISDIVSHIQTLHAPETDTFGRLTGRPLRLRGLLKKVVVIPPKGRFWENRIQTRSCYQLKVWDDVQESYTMKMNERAVLEFRIGEAVFDDYVDKPRKDGKLEYWNPRRASFQFEEDYDVAPMLLDCFLVSTVGDRKGDPMFDGKPRGYSRETQGNETAHGLLVQGVPGSDGGRKNRIGLFRGDEGLSFYFDDALECEFDFE